MARFFFCFIFLLLAFPLRFHAETQVYVDLMADEIMVDGKRCYPMNVKGWLKNGHWRNNKKRNLDEWELFCGEFTNFHIEKGYLFPLVVEEYSPVLDTIHVIKVNCRFEPHVWDQYRKPVEAGYRKWKHKQRFGK
ncbi:MAG: hypothetical protein IKP27_08225 [Paludibacteraceae bacterium]|nr:hypothetical protein [Paludibacteraceae bacterium]